MKGECHHFLLQLGSAAVTGEKPFPYRDVQWDSSVSSGFQTSAVLSKEKQLWLEPKNVPEGYLEDPSDLYRANGGEAKWLGVEGSVYCWRTSKRTSPRWS